MPSNTSIFRGRSQETYFTKALPGGTTTLATTEALCTTLEFTASASASAYTIVLPVGSEDAGLRWWIYPNIAGPTLFQIASPNTPASYTLELPLGVRSNVLWTGAGWALLDASGAVADAARNGVPEDGVTDATIALNSLLATGISVRLTRGVTYVVSGSLNVAAAGQKLDLNGATIQRAAQVSTTLTGTVTSGVTTVLPVASTAGFAAGQSVSLTKAGTITALAIITGGSGYATPPTITITGGGGTGADIVAILSGGAVNGFTYNNHGTGYVSNPTIAFSGGGGTGASAYAQLGTTDPTNTDRKILAVGASTITVDGTFNQTFGTGDTLYTCGWTVNLAAQGCALFGPGTIDGNRAHQTYVRWPSCNEARISADHCKIDDVQVVGAMAEGIYINGNYARVRENWVTNANGNGIHLSGATPGSGCTHPVVTGNRVDTTNLDPSAGHADGCIIWSNTIADATIRDNYCANGLSGIGSIDSSDNSDVTVQGNTIRACFPNALDMLCPDTNPVDVVFTGNRIYASGPVRISNQAGSPTVFPGKVVFNDNLLSGTVLQISKAQWIEVVGNLIDGTGSTSSQCVNVAGSTWVSVQNNVCIGNGTGVFVGTSNNVAVQGNQCLLNNVGGIVMNDTGLLGIVISGNLVSNDTTASSSFKGINALSGHVFGNEVNITKGSAGINAPNSNLIVEHNVVRSVGASNSINVVSGTTGVIVRDNMVTAAINDVGDGLHTSGNIIIA